MNIWSVVLGVILALASMGSVGSAADLVIEHESRSSSDKDNIWYRTDQLEVFVLRTANLELEAGLRHHVGPFTFTTKFGGVWNMADNTPHAMLSENIVMKFGRLTLVSVNEFSLEGFTLEKPKIDWAYNEGFVVVGLDGWLPNCAAGVFFEHYRKAGDEVWVVGPRFDLKIKHKYLRKISVWSGVTDNPTAGIFFVFATEI